MAKASAGSVVVRSKKDRLVLIFTWLVSLGGDGRRREIPTGLDDVRSNWPIAEEQAKLIQRDIRQRTFDLTLAKYRGEKASRLTVTGLFEQFIEYKRPQLYKATLAKYRGLLSTIVEEFGDAEVDKIDSDRAMAFRAAIAQRFAPETVKDKLTLIAAAWDWGIKRKLVGGENPWEDARRSHKTPPRQAPKTFSSDEMRAIVQAFRGHRYYAHYADFVEFFLSVGCRTGEAAGLRWCHLSEDCSEVWIGESVTVDGDRKAAKGNRARGFPLSRGLQAMLIQRRGDGFDPNGSVFPSPGGKLISARNFARRAWKTVLQESGINYQRPYKLRHSNATISIREHGQHPLDVARRLGHNPRTMFDRYVGGEGAAPPEIL